MREGYKMTELGEIPEDWVVRQINEVTSYVDYRGKTPPKVDSGVYLVTARNIKRGKIDYSLSEEYVPKEFYDDIMSRGLPQIGDVLITTEAPLGEIAAIDNENVALAQRIIKYRGISNLLDNDYLKHSMMSPYFQELLDKESTGSTVKGIKGSRLHKLSILLPPLPEQQKIATILSTVDEKIEVIDAQITQTRELKKGLMQKLLTRGIGHTKFKDSVLGEIPESWEVKELATISSITRLAGYEYSEYWKEDINGDITALRGFNIGKNKIIYKNLVKISNELSLQLNRSRLYKGDIVFPCVGTIGNAVVIEEDDKFHINQNIAKITPNEDLYPYYLVQFLLSDLCKKEIDRFNATTSQPNVLVGSLRKFRIPFPIDKTEQQKIASILSSIDDKLEILETKKEAYQQLKKGLMQQLLTGKVRVVQSELQNA